MSAQHLDGKTETSLKQMAAQLRGELGHFPQVDSLSKSHDEGKLPRTAQLGRMGQVSQLELKDASVQTLAVEGDTRRFQNEGKREAWGEKPPDAVFHAEGLSENLRVAPGRQAAAPPFPNGIDKVSFSVYYSFVFLIYTNERLKNSILISLLFLMYVKSSKSGVPACT